MYLPPSIIVITIDQHEKMLEGFDIEQLVPSIKCPFLLLRGEAHLSSIISDDDIEQMMQLSHTLQEKNDKDSAIRSYQRKK